MERNTYFRGILCLRKQKLTKEVFLMENSIHYFGENGIPKLEKFQINFMKSLSLFDECVEETKKYF